MFKTTKQSLVDWQVTINNEHAAWIHKETSKNYSVVFKGYEKVIGFASLTIAKRYAKLLLTNLE